MEHLGFDYPLSPALATDIGFPWGSEDHAPAIPSWQPNADYGIVAASDVDPSDALFDLHGIMTTAILTRDSCAPDLSTSPTTMDSMNSSVSADFPQQQGGSSFWLPEVDLMATYEKLVNASSESSLLLPSDDPSAVVASNDQLRVQRLRSSSMSYSGSGNASSSAESDGYQSYSSHKEREASATPPLPPHRHLQLPTATASPKCKADLGATASVSDILPSSNSRGGFQITFGNHPKRPRLERNRLMHSSIVDFRPAAANGAYEPDAEAIAHMKEMIYRAAAMRPVNLGTEAPVEMPKRKKVRISSDPQTVAARHRRERISERLRVLQRLVPGGCKMDTAAMLDEAASYLKFLKSQVADMERLEGKRMNRSVIKNSAACSTSSSSSPALPLPHQQYQSSSPSFPLLFPYPSSFCPKPRSYHW